MLGATGFVYVATGRQWVEEAVSSAATLRTHHPREPIAIHTDLPELAATGPFDTVLRLPDRPWVRSEAKVSAMGQPLFERTVFLDTDTYICGSLAPLFEVLGPYDLAAAPVHVRVPARRTAAPDVVPDAFQSVNSGMLAFIHNDTTAALFAEWWKLYQADLHANPDGYPDQPSLWVALWRIQPRLLHVPAEFNFRLHYPAVAAGPVRMIHGRAHDAAALERRVNRTHRLRLVIPAVGPRAEELLRRWARYLRYGNIRETLRNRLRNR